ncbi:MAG: glycosyltransferase [Hyphomicrobiales bacterium]|nr:glycosyltransferase [Hyphomicrobiales bacterium]
MRIALGIVKLFPAGGLQRDCIRLVRILVARGHAVSLFTAENSWPFEQPPCPIEPLPVRAYTNHRTDRKFAERFAAATVDGYDCVVGFNKLTDLDVYYCADPSVFERSHHWLERLLPRHSTQLLLEKACFSPLARTHVLALTESAKEHYRQLWRTPKQRITVLPPSIDPLHQRPDLRTTDRRRAVRTSLGIPDSRTVWLWVGAQSHTKGLDRALAALRSSPDTTLLAAGVASDCRNARRAAKSVADQPNRSDARFLGFREDIPDLMAAADVLVHPSRLDVTGQVILEAVVNGLPTVVTARCGFAEHVEKSGAGIVLPEPFAQADLETALAQLRDPVLARSMSEAGIRYGQTISPVNGLEQAADAIERCARTAPEPLPTAISVIVATYNRVDALDAVLSGLAKQSDSDFEIIVADDGSTPHTAAVVQVWRERLPQRLVHIWHEHRGFRAAEIRNRAILASRGAYCIFLDGDCIPRRHFVQEHRRLAEPGWFVVGNRVLMSKALSERVLAGKAEPDRWTLWEAVCALLKNDINRIAPLLQTKLGPMRKTRSRSWSRARSCNLGVWREDLERVDGFDGSYVGWGLEDSDLLIRLVRAGVKRKDGWFSTGVLHLWHPLGDSTPLSVNDKLLDAVLRQRERILPVRGMSLVTVQGRAPAAQHDERFSQQHAAAP